jgi:uncharacterized membrane protein
MIRFFKHPVSRILMAVFYMYAGINHFINPDFYTPLVPDYFPEPLLLHQLAGVIEVVLGGLLLVNKYRSMAAWGILAMLIAFIPAHIYFLQIGCCIPDGLCTPMWVGWLRLLVIHPLLMGWAWVFTGK